MKAKYFVSQIPNSDYLLQASFKTSSQKVYVDSYSARHTRRAGVLSGYKAQVKNSYSTGEGTKQAKVKATYKLLYKGSAAPGTNETYLQVIYNNDKSWQIKREL